MSTLQQVKPKNEVKTSNALTCEQSQRLVQTMLTMSFGCLSFLRGLFPDDNFVDQRFVPEKVDRNYRKDKSSTNANSIKIKTLVRGKTAEADLFLDWLEKGVFQSIKLKYLKALSLGIFIDENSPTELLENYIFGFSYDEGGNVSMQVNDENDQISLLDSRKVVQQLMRRFIIITQSLEPLPEKRYLTMRLMFNESAPSEYQPHLFRDSTNDVAATIKIPESADLETYSVGSLDTKYHKVSLKVLSVIETAAIREEEIMRNLDPFDLIDNHNFQERVISDHLEPNISSLAASQTTNMLQGFLKTSPLCATQAQFMDDSSTHDCECGVSHPTPLSKTLHCVRCGKRVHRLCYGNFRGSNISNCISCLGASSMSNSFELKVMMMLRRIYRFMTKKPAFPKSVTALYEVLLGKDFDSNNVKQVNMALSILFTDKVLELSDTRKKGSSTNAFLKSSNYIDIDHDGILAGNAGELICNTRKVWTFVHNSPHVQNCYSMVLIQTEAELVDALKSVKNSIASIESVKDLNDDSYAFSNIRMNSLKISDDTQESLSTGKRQFANMDEFTYNEENGQSIETQTTNDSYSNKIRKVSVSKKTLKSVW